MKCQLSEYVKIIWFKGRWLVKKIYNGTHREKNYFSNLHNILTLNSCRSFLTQLQIKETFNLIEYVHIILLIRKVGTIMLHEIPIE